MLSGIKRMPFTRRELLKAVAASSAGVAAAPSLEAMAAALAEKAPAAPLVWVNDGGDGHNLLALLGQEVPSFLRLIALQWDVRDYGPLLPTGFVSSQPSFQSAPVLIMEAVPPHGDEQSAAAKKIREILPQAKAAILLGTDACFGGIRASGADVAGIEALCKQEKTPLIKLPGIPVPPHHLLGTLSHLEYFGFPRLDGLRRPLLYYGETVCQQCERRDDLETGRFAQVLGASGCLLRLGCKGPITHNSCSKVRWNGGENWCVGAGGPCTGCSEPGFPTHGGLGLYGALRGGAFAEQSVLLQNLEGIGLTLIGLAGAGIALHLVRRALMPGEDETEEKSGPGGNS
jgi:Ni,Fe-hydrogenase I small subunit